jgi:hypothetical protein
MPVLSTNKRFKQFSVCCVALLCFALTVSGCGSSAESHEDEHHEHEHEHLEHFVPAHKPKDFAELVDQLALRFPQLESTSPGAGHDAARKELADIIDWIPELAADSELRKADFETAVATVTGFANALKETATATKAASVDPPVFESLIEELRQLVPKSQVQAEQM